jgi:hypothetical protein
VRNLRWAKLQYVSLELHHAVGHEPLVELTDGVRKRIEAEKELLVDPRVCSSLVEVLDLASARVHLKTGRHRNELVRFRYDLTLKARSADLRAPASATWTDWGSIASLDATASSSEGALLPLAARLAALAPTEPVLAVRGIPNARLVGLARALERLRRGSPSPTTLDQLRADAASSDGVEPQDLFDLANAHGFVLELGASDVAYQCDALFVREGGPPAEVVFGAGGRRALDECATEPTNRGRARFGKRLVADLAEEKPKLAARSVVNVVDRLPRHTDGSIDHGAFAEEVL